MKECVACKKMAFSWDKEVCLSCGSGATLWSEN